jgi:hypothetical protein
VRAVLLATLIGAVATLGVLAAFGAFTPPPAHPALAGIGHQLMRTGDAIAVTALRVDAVPVPVPVPGTPSCTWAPGCR